MDVSDIFNFFLLGGRASGSPARKGRGVGCLLKIPGGGLPGREGGGMGPGGCLRGIWGGGGLILFFGPEIPTKYYTGTPSFLEFFFLHRTLATPNFLQPEYFFLLHYHPPSPPSCLDSSETICAKNCQKPTQKVQGCHKNS